MVRHRRRFDPEIARPDPAGHPDADAAVTADTA